MRAISQYNQSIMATYAIGDIQGCYHAFMALVARLQFNVKHDTLWLVGDLINRGSGSIDVPKASA